MLAGVVEIDNLRGARKVQADKIPNPFGAVANHDLLECTTPATSPSFGIDSPAKLFRTLDGSGIRGGIGIADGIAFLIPLRLGEDASQFLLPEYGPVGPRSCPADRPSLSSPPELPSHPAARTGCASARRQPRAGPTGGLCGSRLVRAERYRLRWPPRYAPRIW